MKLDRTNTNRTVEGNMPSLKKSPLRISEGARNHLMETLSNLYSDPVMAVIREYYANGYDSHKKAGVSRPVEITLPTAYTPSFIVRDYGLGMSAQFIDDVFLEYGESTKNDDNDVIGALGYGGKSGFAVSDQFTVTSFHDGKKITVLFEKTPDGYDSNIVSIVDTDEGNGVVVTIPVSQNHLNDFSAKAREIFFYTDPGTVIVDGKSPENLWETETWTDTKIENEELTILSSLSNDWNTRRDVRLIMGGIPYSVPPNEVSESLSRVQEATGLDVSIRNSTIYAKVPMASFDLNYSREGVRVTSKTKDLLDRVFTLFFKELVSRSENIINKVEDYRDVFPLLEGLEGYIDIRGMKWKGLPVKTSVTAKYDLFSVYKRSSENADKDHRSKIYLKNYLSLSEPTYLITGRSVEDFASKDSKRVSAYLLGAEISKVRFLAVGNALEDAFEAEDLKYLEHSSEYEVMHYSSFLKTVRAGEKIRRELYAAKKAEEALNGPKEAAKPKEIKIPVLDITTDTVEWVVAGDIKEDAVYLWSQNMITPFDSSRGARRAVTSYISTDEYAYRYTTKGLSAHLKQITDATQVILLAGHRTPTFLSKHSGKKHRNVVNDAEKTVVDVLEEMDSRSAALLTAYNNSTVENARIFLKDEYLEKIADPDLKSVLTQDKHAIADRSPLVAHALDYLAFTSISLYDFRGKVAANQRKLAKESKDAFDFESKYPLLTMLTSYRYASTKPEAVDHLINYLNDIYSKSKTLVIS